MNEELLQLAYSKFQTDADYETFKADLLESEDLQRLAYDKFETDADFETFRNDLVGEKKNPSQNEPSGESLSEDTKLDSSDPQQEDGSAESLEAQDDLVDLVPKGDSGVDKHILVVPDSEKKKGEKREFFKDSFMGGISRLNEMITGLGESAYTIAALPQNIAAWALDKPEWEANVDKFKEVTGLENPVLDFYKEETKKIQEKTQAFKAENYESSSISDNISSGNYSDAFDLLGAGILENAPTSAAMMASGATLGLSKAAALNTAVLLNQEVGDIRASDPKASEAEVVIKAISSAGAESVFAAVGTGTIGQVYKDIIKKEGTEVGIKIFKDGLAGVYKNALKKFGAPIGALGEGIEEAVTQITQNMIKDRPVMEGVTDAFILGVGSGGAMTAPITASNLIQDQANRIDKASAEVVKEQAMLEGVDIPLDIPAVDDTVEGVDSPIVTKTPPENVSGKTQEFFADVVEGNLDKYKPSKEYEYTSEFNDEQTSFQEEYDTHKGNFDEHIATSIPDFRDTQVKKGAAIVKSLPDGGVVYDLGGSEGGFAKSITKQSGGKIKTINVDPNPSMKEAFDKTPVEGAEIVQEAFQEGFEDVKAHKPKVKGDVVHESMLFQFISPERASKVKEVKDKYLKPKGVFITEQKFKLTDENQQGRNEEIKDKKHKSKYFTEEQIKTKGEDVLVGMSDNQSNFDEYVDELNKQFKYVETYWTSGNFRGVAASDSKVALKKIINNIGDTTNSFTAPESAEFTAQKRKADIEAKKVEIEAKKQRAIKKGKEPKEESAGQLKPKEEATLEILEKRKADEEVTPEQAVKDSKKFADEARKEQSKKDTKHISAVSKTIGKLADMLSDRQGSVKRILKRAGLTSTIDYMVAKLGAASYAKNLADKAHARTFDRLSQADIRTLEEIIQNKRTIAIDANRKKRGLSPVKHQGGFTTVSAEKALEGYKKQLGDKKYNDLTKRAEAFFDEYQNLLKVMKEEGLISQETFDIFVNVDYQPKVYLQFLKDMEGNFLSEELDNFETSSLSAEQIKSMRGGSEGLQSMDSQGLLQRSILARAKAVFSNRVNNVFATEYKDALKRLKTLLAKKNKSVADKKQIKNLKELKSNIKIDKIVDWTETGKPIYALAKVDKTGWKAIYHYNKGVASRIWMKQDFHEKFTDTNNQIFNATTRENISKGSGTRLIKSFATGNNPLFLLTNIPRDLAFAIAFSKEYGKGAKTIVPIEIMKLAKDFGRGAGQAIAEGSMYQKYLEYGGGMDFLTVQGRYGKQGIFNRYVENKVADRFIDAKHSAVPRAAKKVMDFLKKMNTASEFATRIAVFDRSIKNQLKAKGVKDISELGKDAQDLVYTKAVRSARELTDFNQGGKFTKSLDAAVPYLNAATQGTRSAIQNMSDRPIETTSRILQVAGGFTALVTTAAFGFIGVSRDTEDEDIKDMSQEEIYFETLNGVSAYDLRNYYIFPLGQKDDRGNWRYRRIAKAQALTPFVNTAEHYLRKYYSEAHGIEYKQDLAKELHETIQTNILPIGFSIKEPFKDNVGRVPIVNAYVASLGIDAYTGNPLDWKHGKIPTQLEGITDDRVEGFFKSMGEKLDVSPVRMKAITESFITTPSTNPYVGLGYLGAEFISTGEKKDIVGNFTKAASKRWEKSTSEYNEISKALERVNSDVVDAYRKHILIEKAVRDAVKDAKKSDSGEGFEETFKDIFEKNPDMAEKAISWAKSEFKKKKLNPFVSSLRFETNKDVRAILIAEKFGDALIKGKESDFNKREQQILRELINEKVVDAEVLKRYKKLFED